MNTHQQDSHIISLEFVGEEDRCLQKFQQHIRLVCHNSEEWVKERKVKLILMATIMSGMSFTLFINTLGGVFKASVNERFDCPTTSTIINFPNATRGI